ncbi:hypothetical protein [Halosegnis marinus]|uniref:Uncharacterized protein n=1 Tax=Halosegnis marinus TaxID=3034023 RepID=A0ABD5ZR97_9EURY|nr:hypothetical protein [Halosegnis sp. DT85]
MDLDSETLFDVAAGAIAAVAVLFFMFSVDTGLSPVTTVAAVLAFAGGVFAVSQRDDDRTLMLVGYAVVVVTVVGLVARVVGVFRAGSAAVVAALLVVALAIFLLRERLDEDGRLATPGRARAVFAVLLVLAVAVVAVDVGTGGLTYDLDAESEVTVPTGDERHGRLTVATLVASNPTPLPERVEAPQYNACTAGDWSAYRFETEPGEPTREAQVRAYVDDGYNEHVLSFGERRFPVELNVNGRNVSGETFPVEVASECPDNTSGDPYVVLFPDPDTPRRIAV